MDVKYSSTCRNEQNIVVFRNMHGFKAISLYRKFHMYFDFVIASIRNSVTVKTRAIEDK